MHNFYLTPTRNEEKRHSIKVSPSTISRELKRNSGRRGGYNWETAQKNAFIISIVALATDLSDKMSRRRP